MTHDLARIQPQHEAVHERCQEWAKWVRLKSKMFSENKMWDNYMSKSRQWEAAPPIPICINQIAALEVERAVAKLAHNQRTVLRWCYVWPALHVNAVARELQTDRDGLGRIRDEALSRLVGQLET